AEPYLRTQVTKLSVEIIDLDPAGETTALHDQERVASLLYPPQAGNATANEARICHLGRFSSFSEKYSNYLASLFECMISFYVKVWLRTQYQRGSGHDFPQGTTDVSRIFVPA